MAPSEALASADFPNPFITYVFKLNNRDAQTKLPLLSKLVRGSLQIFHLII